MPTPIVVYGSATCEDTAIVRSRLAAVGVPFTYVDIDGEPAAAARVEAWNGGHRVTPTVVLGSDEQVVAEPTLERLGELVAAGGYAVDAIDVTQYHGERIGRAIPFATLPTADGGTFSVANLRGKRQAALFLGHDAGCLACFGYARQLAAAHADLGEADAVALIVVGSDPAAVAGWRHGVDPQSTILADADGAWKRAVTASIEAAATDAVVIVLDRYGAPRAGASVAEAGGLPDPSAIVEWLRFIALDCPECSGELPWPGI